MGRVFHFTVDDQDDGHKTTIIRGDNTVQKPVLAELYVCDDEDLPSSANKNKVYLTKSGKFYQGQGIGSPMKEIKNDTVTMPDGSVIDLSKYRKKEDKIGLNDLEQDVLDKLGNKGAILNEYEDKFYVTTDENRTEFQLTHTPIGKIKLFIDGIRYFNNNETENYFTYNKEKNIITWINTDEDSEGFQLSDMDIVFEYQYMTDSRGDEKDGTN